MKKGSRLLHCDSCARRRACQRRTEGDWWIWRCTQGHEWKQEIPRLEKVLAVAKAQLLPVIRQAFEASNPFYAALRRQ